MSFFMIFITRSKMGMGLVERCPLKNMKPISSIVLKNPVFNTGFFLREILLLLQLK